jgi:hypothetical protein
MTWAYAIPKHNPFAKAEDSADVVVRHQRTGYAQNKIGSRPEIWAHGLRNLFHFDQKSDLCIADVGRNPLRGNQLSTRRVKWVVRNAVGLPFQAAEVETPAEFQGNRNK